MTIPTTLVLGAGASIHLGFPLAVGLREAICSNLTRTKEGFKRLIECGVRAEEITSFHQAFSQTPRIMTIDEFVEYRPQFEKVARLAIAHTLIPGENVSLLFSTSSAYYKKWGDWYGRLFSQIKPPPLELDLLLYESRLSIITFNYERSLEQYLATTIQRLYDTKWEEAAKIVAKLPIIHMHGSLGPFFSECNWYRPYDRQATNEEGESPALS